MSSMLSVYMKVKSFTSTLKRKYMGCGFVNILYISTPIKSNCVKRSEVGIPEGQRVVFSSPKVQPTFQCVKEFFLRGKTDEA